jgi:ABC-type multidrug transport system permease subunit
MARISIVLLVLIIAALVLLYYRLVLARQRGEV